MAFATQIKTPKVLNPVTVARIAEANEALRQLRQLGCKVVRLSLGLSDSDTEILIDRNPHRTLVGCPGVHVTCEVGQ